MSVLQILNAIAKEDKTTLKEKIMVQHQHNDDLKRCFQFAYNKQISFGISRKTIPDVCSIGGLLSLKEGLDFLEKNLSTRNLTGNVAIDSLKSVMERANSDDAEVLRRVLMRDLEVSVGQTVSNKVWKGICPKQPQMLASAQSDDLIDKIIDGGNAFAELKADGARCFSDIEAKVGVSFASRNGNEYTMLNRIEKALLSSGFGNWVVDGELVYKGKSFENVGTLDSFMDNDAKEGKVADREEGNGIVSKSLSGHISIEEADGIVYQVWDIVPRDVYYGERKCPKEFNQQKRREMLIQMINSIDDEYKDCVELIKSTPVKTKEDALRIYREYVALGFEGIILKCGNALWKNTRSKDCVKFKEKIRVDLLVVGAYPHKKDPTKLGGFNLRSACGLIEVNIGSGFTDTYRKKLKVGKGKTAKSIWVPIPLKCRLETDRELLWTLRHQIVDAMIIELECNGLQASKSRKKGEAPFSLFLPVFKLFRRDKSEANKVGDVFPDYELLLK